MEDKMIIKCGTDEIHINDIQKVYIIAAEEQHLISLEEKHNGAFFEYDSSSENLSISIDVQQEIEELLNKYWREIAYYLPAPHKNFLPDSQSSFVLIKNSEYERTNRLDDSKTNDVFYKWNYHFHVDDPCGGHRGSNETVISLRKDILPVLRKISSLKPQTKKKKRSKELKDLADIGLMLLGISSIRLGDDSTEIDDSLKAKIKSICEKTDNFYKAKGAADRRQKLYNDFIETHMGEKILIIKTSSIVFQYLASLCGFDIYSKKLEIEKKRSECQMPNWQDGAANTNGKKDSAFPYDLLKSGEIAYYKNYRLVKDDNTILFGNEKDPYIITIEIFKYSNNRPQRILMQLVDSKTKAKILRQKEFNNGLIQALHIGSCWLNSALEAYAREQEQEKQNNSNNRGEKDVAYVGKRIVTQKHPRYVQQHQRRYEEGRLPPYDPL